LKAETRDTLKALFFDFARKSAPQYTVEELRRAYPFHSLFFPDAALLYFKQQRSLVTSMGMSLYPQVWELIARDKYSEVHSNYELPGNLPEPVVAAIERIITELRTGGRRARKPDVQREMREILSAPRQGQIEVRIIADLYVGDFHPGPLFMEIKSPLPNLDVCAESKKKLLFFRALYEGRRPQAFFAFPYNPYVRRGSYAWGFTKRIMDVDKEVLIGEEMWDKLGGEGTFDELLEVIGEVARKLRQ
jgi:hypothetical protein